MSAWVKWFIDNPIAATQLLTKNVGLTESEQEAVQNNLITAGDASIWGLANALTATARNLDMERKLEMEVAAGRLLEDPKHWKVYANAQAA